MTDAPEAAFARLRAAFSLAAVPDPRARVARLHDLSRAIQGSHAEITAAIAARRKAMS